MELLRAIEISHLANEIRYIQDDLLVIDGNKGIENAISKISFVTEQEQGEIIKLVEKYIKEKLTEREAVLKERLDKM